MTAVDLLGLVLLGIAASLGFAILAGGLLAFGEARLGLEEFLEIEAEGPMRRPRRIGWRSRGDPDVAGETPQVTA